MDYNGYGYFGSFESGSGSAGGGSGSGAGGGNGQSTRRVYYSHSLWQNEQGDYWVRTANGVELIPKAKFKPEEWHKQSPYPQGTQKHPSELTGSSHYPQEMPGDVHQYATQLGPDSTTSRDAVPSAQADIGTATRYPLYEPPYSPTTHIPPASGAGAAPGASGTYSYASASGSGQNQYGRGVQLEDPARSGLSKDSRHKRFSWERDSR